MIPNSWRTFIIAFFIGATLLSLVSFSSIHNSDDAIYSVVIRSVTEGYFWPLHFADNVFQAKPPLFFWLGGLLVHLFGNHDFVYRLIPFFLFISVGLISLRYIPSLFLVLLLGSPALLEFSSRVMIDLPIAMLGLLLLLLAGGSKKERWIPIFALGAVGWWLKELAILPVFLSSILIELIRFPPKWKNRNTWVGFFIFISALFLLRFLCTSTGTVALPTANSVAAPFWSEQPSALIYYDLIHADSPFLWLTPFALYFSFRYGNQQERWLVGSFATGIVAHTVAVFMSKSVLPHYLLPIFPLSLAIVAIALHQIRNPQAKIFVLLLAFLQFFRSYNEIDRHPADATRELAVAAAAIVPVTSPICVLDSYIPGFIFYSKRSVQGIYVSDRAYRSQARIPEFSNMIQLSATANITSLVKEKCAGVAILPAPVFPILHKAEIVAKKPPLLLAVIR